MVHPGLVAAVFSVLLTFITCVYFFAVPAALKAKGSTKGHWGDPDGEFNWCELDYQLSLLIAEPLNTATGMLYIIAAVGAWYMHRKHFPFEGRMLLILLLILMLGIGTVLFHATLRYSMQLLDELPIYYLILLGVWGMHERGAEPVHGSKLAALLSGWAMLATIILQATPKDDPVHQAIRGIMTCSFSASFVYIFWAAARACSEHKQLTGKNDMRQLFSRAFWWFVIAIVCWLVDNTVCDVLQSFRWYPNLHAWGWHCGTVGGLYLLFLALFVQRLGTAGVACKVERIGWVLPVLRPHVPHGKAE